jgi:phospholipid transport system substrate-binding protein
MVPYRLFLCVAFVVLSLVLSVPSVRAEVNSDQAATFIQDFGDRVISNLTEEGLTTEQLQDRFHKLYTEGFDSLALSRFVLGRYWKSTNKEERAEFLMLFNKFVIQTYSSKFRHYSGETFAVTGVQPEGNNIFIVSSEVLQPGGAPPITLIWRVVRSDSGFLIYDITVEGVSMAITQRSEFASVIRNGGGKVSTLIVALGKKTKELSIKNAEEMGSTN